MQTAQGGLLSGYNKDIAYDPDGFVYTTSGEVVDVHVPLNPSYVGSFASSGAVLPLPGPTAIMVSGSTLLKLDASTFSQVGSRDTGCGPFETVTDLVHVAPGRVAFVAFDPDVADSGAVCVVTDPGLIP